MKNLFFLFTFIICFNISYAQLGIGNTDPKAKLDISASSVDTPSNTDGILIPRIDEFPDTDPGTDQDGMMVFITGNGSEDRGFYYWNSTSWSNVNEHQKSIVKAHMSAHFYDTNGFLPFNTVEFDTKNEFDTVNNRFVVSKTGYYRINAEVEFFGMSTTNNNSQVSIYVNGSTLKQRGQILNSQQSSKQINVDGIFLLNANDYVQIYAGATSSTGFGINYSPTNTFFEIQQID